MRTRCGSTDACCSRGVNRACEHKMRTGPNEEEAEAEEEGEEEAYLQLVRRDGAARAQVAEGDRCVRLELLVGVLEQLEQRREAAVLDDGRRLQV